MTRVFFEDHGQDFLWWDIDSNGVVVDAGPFQSSIWKDCVTSIPEEIEIGEHLTVTIGIDDEMTLKYRVERKEDLDDTSNTPAKEAHSH